MKELQVGYCGRGPKGLSQGRLSTKDASGCSPVRHAPFVHLSIIIQGQATIPNPTYEFISCFSLFCSGSFLQQRDSKCMKRCWAMPIAKGYRRSNLVRLACSCPSIPSIRLPHAVPANKLHSPEQEKVTDLDLQAASSKLLSAATPEVTSPNLPHQAIASFSECTVSHAQALRDIGLELFSNLDALLASRPKDEENPSSEAVHSISDEDLSHAQSLIGPVVKKLLNLSNDPVNIDAQGKHNTHTHQTLTTQC